MRSLPQLKLPEEWKQRTHVFIVRKGPSQIMNPLVTKGMYDADRERADFGRKASNGNRPKLAPKH